MWQEKRLNKATEVMLQYVENLKRTYEKDHAELMEFKKLATQNSNYYGATPEIGGNQWNNNDSNVEWIERPDLLSVFYAFLD